MTDVSNAPNVTDWFQAVGTVLAFAVTGMGLLWEIRSRRLENVDRAIAQARAVVISVAPPPMSEDDIVGFSFEEAFITVINFSFEPITNLAIRLPDMGDFGEVWPSFIPSVGPGSSFIATWTLSEAFHYGGGNKPRLIDGEAEKLTIDYQIAGRRWVRGGNAEPKPWPGSRLRR